MTVKEITALEKQITALENEHKEQTHEIQEIKLGIVAILAELKNLTWTKIEKEITSQIKIANAEYLEKKISRLSRTPLNKERAGWIVVIIGGVILKILDHYEAF